MVAKISKATIALNFPINKIFMTSMTKNLNSLEFCDLCFQRGRPNLCEASKNTFTKISSLHFSQQAKLDKILNGLEITPRLVDRQWTCVMDSQKRAEFLDSLWGINVTVHTLEDHARTLSRLYKPETRKLGKPVTVELEQNDSWEEFNPKSRRWDTLKTHNKNEKFTTKTSLGNILRHTSTDGIQSYFRVNLANDLPALVPMERRAAFNIISTISEPTSISWMTDDAKKYGFIKEVELENIPDEIRDITERLSSRNKKLPQFLIFENQDFELLKNVLSGIKITLTESNDKIDYKLEKTSKKQITISDIEESRLHTLTKIVQDIGGVVEIKDEQITISGKRGIIKVTFIEDAKSLQSGNEMTISTSAIEDPSRLIEILHTIKKKLGLLDLPLESMVSQNWPIITDLDLQYIVQSAISWWQENPVLALKIITENNKFEKIKEWHEKIKAGKTRSNLDTITLGKIIKKKET